MSGLPNARSFRRIVCAVDGSAADGEAARQAAISVGERAAHEAPCSVLVVRQSA